MLRERDYGMMADRTWYPLLGGAAAVPTSFPFPLDLLRPILPGSRDGDSLSRLPGRPRIPAAAIAGSIDFLCPEWERNRALIP